MDKTRKLSQLYKTALLEDVIPFWIKYSIDWTQGGYFTCLNRDGSVFDNDKFVWLQARQLWMFSILYNQVDQKIEWLDIAHHGADFLRKNGMDKDGNWYFSLNRAGSPLIQPYNIFSDCFAAMAFAQYAIAARDTSALDLSKRTYRNILARQQNPKGIYNKAVRKTRPIKGFALPMILCNLTLELESFLTSEEVENQVEQSTHDVLDIFLEPESLLISENVGLNGEFINSFEGRLINPGHAIEAMWFLMDVGSRLGDVNLINRCIDVVLATLRFGWDKEFGGIFYFLDRLGYPPQQLEWDQKLWWVHLETLVALVMGYELTGREECWEWFIQVHDYSWNHFPDPKYGEWFGYLNRKGELLLPLKGGKWKGCFHVPRALLRCWKVFQSIDAAR